MIFVGKCITIDIKVVKSGLKGNKVDNVDNFVDNIISQIRNIKIFSDGGSYFLPDTLLKYTREEGVFDVQGGI